MVSALPQSPQTPIPKLQTTIALLIQAAEALSAFVILPFIPQFVQDTGITGGDERKTGYWAGVLESIFFIAEFLSVYTWGRAADRFGRRPILLLGPLGLAFSLFGFGCSKTFTMLVIFRCAQGVFNGNIGVVKTVMAEISDSTNLAQMMAFIPIAWSSGTTLGPIIGGLLSNPEQRWPNSLGKLQFLRDHPYLLPCAAVGLLSFSFFLLGLVGLKESSPVILSRRKREKLRVADPSFSTNLLAESQTSYGAIAGAEALEPSASSEEQNQLTNEEVPTLQELLVPRLLIPLLNYAFYCFCQTAHQVLLPLTFSTSIANGGLGFSPYLIGVIRGVWGVFNTLFQLLCSARLIARLGPRTMFIFAFANFALCIGAYPVLNLLARRAGRADALVWAVIVIQGASNLGVSVAYASVQTFIVLSAPRPSALSSTNSIAQMVATIVRALAPFIASALFAVSLEWEIAGGYMVYVLLLGVVAAGIYSSFFLRNDSKAE